MATTETTRHPATSEWQNLSDLDGAVLAEGRMIYGEGPYPVRVRRQAAGSDAPSADAASFPLDNVGYKVNGTDDYWVRSAGEADTEVTLD